MIHFSVYKRQEAVFKRNHKFGLGAGSLALKVRCPGGKEGGREGRREGGRKGRREGGREGGREGSQLFSMYTLSILLNLPWYLSETVEINNDFRAFEC